MSKKIAVFWPGDARDNPNELALPNMQEATAQLERALKKLGRAPYLVPGFLSKPHEAIEKLGPIDDPMIGVCVHWFYGPHTTDGVVGKDNPLLLASNFSGRWPGLVGLLNTGACLESLDRPFSRAWTDAQDFSSDDGVHGAPRRVVHERQHPLRRGGDPLSRADLARRLGDRPRSGRARSASAACSSLMLGDTSMGMINGYFGPRLLNRHGFTEHKVDQAWIIDRGRRIDQKRIDDAFAFVKEKGLTFHHREAGAEDFDEAASSEQLRDYLVVLDMLEEFKADCLGWQYQLGLIPLRPPSDLAEGLFNSTCRPESNGDTIATATEADQGNVDADGDDEAALEAKGSAPSRDVPRRALGRRARRALLVGAAQLRLVRRVRVQPRPGHAARRALLSPAVALLPDAGRHASPARACPAR